MYRGEYTKTTSIGLTKKYQSNDVVLFEGNLYKAKRNVELSPFQEAIAWEFIGTSRVFSGSEPPINPVEGQQWERNGTIYTYYFDGDNYAWVEF